MFAFAPSTFTGALVRPSTGAVCTRPARAAAGNVTMQHGKGFGGGEATRNPETTFVDPNDPKGKQKAIHPAETFAEYQARQSGGGGASPAAPSTPAAPAWSPPKAAAPAWSPPKADAPAWSSPKADAPAWTPPKADAPSWSSPSSSGGHGGKGFGGGEATRNPDTTYVDPNDPKGKQKAIHPAETFAEYQARTSGGAASAPASSAPKAASSDAVESFAEYQARMQREGR